MTSTETAQDEGHFAFGENWADFAKGLDQTAIAEAEAGLLKLLDRRDLAGASFLDIGCGSGLHALAALRLGASPLLAIDVMQIPWRRRPPSSPTTLRGRTGPSGGRAFCKAAPS